MEIRRVELEFRKGDSKFIDSPGAVIVDPGAQLLMIEYPSTNLLGEEAVVKTFYPLAALKHWTLVPKEESRVKL
jgi:hypothetical protein